MESELEKFIKTENYKDFKDHIIFIYQLFLLEKNFNETTDSHMSVFPILLQYISIGTATKHKAIKAFMEKFNEYMKNQK